MCRCGGAGLRGPRGAQPPQMAGMSAGVKGSTPGVGGSAGAAGVVGVVPSVGVAGGVAAGTIGTSAAMLAQIWSAALVQTTSLGLSGLAAIGIVMKVMLAGGMCRRLHARPARLLSVPVFVSAASDCSAEVRNR